MAKNRMKTGFFDRDGKFHEVKWIDKLPEDKRVEAEQVVLADMQTEYSCKMSVEASPDFAEELKKMVEDAQNAVLNCYDEAVKAVECCLDVDCRSCPWRVKDDCKKDVSTFLDGVFDLYRRSILKYWNRMK